MNEIAILMCAEKKLKN